MLGWGAVMVGGAAVSSVIDIEIRDKAERRRWEDFNRRTINCKQSNYGCIENHCWANCGPRLQSLDWCLTTNETKIDSKNVSISGCMFDHDCDPCWKCASTCNLEGSELKH